MEKKIPHKFKVRIVAQGDWVQDIFAEATEFYVRNKVSIGWERVTDPTKRRQGITRKEIFETHVTRGYNLLFYFGGKPQTYKLSGNEVEKLIENGEWIIID